MKKLYFAEISKCIPKPDYWFLPLIIEHTFFPTAYNKQIYVPVNYANIVKATDWLLFIAYSDASIREAN